MANESLTLETVADSMIRMPWYTIEADQYLSMLLSMPGCVNSVEVDEDGHRRHTARFDGNAAISSIITVNDNGNDCYLIQQVKLPNGRSYYARGDIGSYARVKLHKG